MTPRMPRLSTFAGAASAALLWVGLVSPGGRHGAVAAVSEVTRRAEPPALAVLRNGVVWISQSRVLYQGFRSGQVTLGGIPPYSTNPVLAASPNAVVLAGAGAGFAGSVPPGRLAPVEGFDEEAREFEGGGCSAWSPEVGSSAEAPAEFVVAEGELVDAGVCEATNGGFDEQELATAQPLFVHRLHGGVWRILRWLKGHHKPILAEEGNLLAIGEPVSGATMRVTILDLASRAQVAQFASPLGELSFASSRRLVVSVSTQARDAGLSSAKRPEETAVLRRSYRLLLYSVNGRPLAYLGTAPEPALVSHMHLLVKEEVEGHTVLAVRNILDGSRRRLIGFVEQARTLEAVAFRWPAVALVETTSVPLTQSEVTCDSGKYHRASPPLLRIFDLAAAEPYVPAPPSAHLAPPAGPCPPRPVFSAGG